MKNSWPRLLSALLIPTALVWYSPQALSQTTDSLNYFLQKGNEEKEKGRKLEALRQFEKALRFDSVNTPLLTELTSIYLDLRKHDRAILTLKRLATLDAATPEQLRQLLELSYTYNQTDDVLAYAARLKKADPAARVQYYVGKVHYANDNYGEAIRSLTEAFKEEPANADIPYVLAHCYTEMENYRQAIPWFEKAIALDTTKPYWIYEMSLLYFSLNDDKNALRYMEEAGRRGMRKDNDYMENLGNAYLNAGKFEEGMAILQDALKRKPSDISLLNTVAEAYYFKGKYDLAIDHWDRILEVDKQNASALYMIGMCFQKKGDKAKGQQLCDKAIEMDPSLQHLRQKKQLPGL